MMIKDLQKIIKNCDGRIQEAKKIYKQAVKEQNVYAQKRAVESIEFNEDLKMKCQKRIDELTE